MTMPDGFSIRPESYEDEWLTVLQLPSRRREDIGADGRPYGTFGCSLLSIHVYVLAQILKRPIIIYAHDAAGADTGESMAGIYLPSLWPPAQCASRIPLTIAFTPGHFTALLPIRDQTTAIPTCSKDGVPLLVKFEDPKQARYELLSQFMDVQCDQPATVRESIRLPQSSSAAAAELPETTQLFSGYFVQAMENYSHRVEMEKFL